MKFSNVLCTFLLLSAAPAVAQNQYTWELASGVTGKAIAAWANNNEIAVITSHYSGGVWSAPEIVPGSELSPGSTIDVAMDSSGNCILLWSCDAGIIWSSVMLSGQSWTTATILSNPIDYCTEPVLTLDPAGNAIGLWMNQTEGMQTSRLSAGGTKWSAVEVISD
jgi:hypothetical protein